MLDNNFNLTEIDEMMQWEKKVYLEILVQKLKERAEAAKAG